jgi:hypothetical protein
MKLEEVEGKEQYRVEISNRFAALENLNDDVDINPFWSNSNTTMALCWSI